MGVSYYHPEAGRRISELIRIDFEAFRGSMAVRTPEHEVLQEAVNELSKLVTEMRAIQKGLEPLDTMVWPSGLRLLISTLKNLQRIRGGEGPEPMHPSSCTPDMIAEALGVDYQLANDIHRMLVSEATEVRLGDLPGMTPELIARLNSLFRWEGKS